VLEGSDNDPRFGDHPAPTDEATREGTIVNNDGLDFKCRAFSIRAQIKVQNTYS
jgi:hypothetical protein